jgi:hypothetical protein
LSNSAVEYNGGDPFANNMYTRFFDKHGLFLVFDLGLHSSFEKVVEIWTEIKNHGRLRIKALALVGFKVVQ